MHRIRDSGEADMVALFLRAELSSPRFGATLAQHLRRDGLPEAILSAPDVADAAENQYRRHLLGVHRGFGEDAELFHGFPSAVRWQWMAVSNEELRQVRYINYDYWIELSGGSRLPMDAVTRINAGIDVFGVSNQGFLAVADRLASGAVFPELILVSAAEDAGLVVMEEHLRLTAYVLRGLAVPAELEVLVGLSPDFLTWPLY